MKLDLESQVRINVNVFKYLVVVVFVHSGFFHNGQWPPTSKDFLSQIISITFISTS